MLFRPFILALALAASVPLATAQTNPAQKETTKKDTRTPAQQRADLDALAAATLAEVYKKYPEAEQKIANAAGYAVFKTGGVQLFLVGGESGDGVAIGQGKHVYMSMVLGKIGVGFGAKEMRTLLVFADQAAFDKFIAGKWSGSSNATAAAKSGSKGGAVTGEHVIDKGVYGYQFTEAGMTAELTIGGSKYSVNKKLNTH
jgi:hypothetical protein